MPRGVKPTAFSRPISRRWASTRPLITVATVKPTTSSANSVLTLITSEFVRVWSVIVVAHLVPVAEAAAGCREALAARRP